MVSQSLFPNLILELSLKHMLHSKSSHCMFNGYMIDHLEFIRPEFFREEWVPNFFPFYNLVPLVPEPQVLVHRVVRCTAPTKSSPQFYNSPYNELVGHEQNSISIKSLLYKLIQECIYSQECEAAEFYINKVRQVLCAA